MESWNRANLRLLHGNVQWLAVVAAAMVAMVFAGGCGNGDGVCGCCPAFNGRYASKQHTVSSETCTAVIQWVRHAHITLHITPSACTTLRLTLLQAVAQCSAVLG